jgi:hypothetical protein
MFGLPIVTSLFVFGGFLVPLALAVWFGLRFRADTDEWLTAGSAPEASVPNLDKVALIRATGGDRG